MFLVIGTEQDIGVVDGLVFNKLLPMWDGEVSEGVELTVTSRKATEDASIGCSIAVNGVCLTATSLTDNKVGLLKSLLLAGFYGPSSTTLRY